MANYRGEDRLEKHYTTEDLLDKLFEMKDRLIDFEITEYLENNIEKIQIKHNKINSIKLGLIYMIELNDRRYIGQTINIKRRIKEIV